MKQLKKIYIVSVNSVVTGGPESLHQLAEAIKKLGYETYIYYIDTKTTDIPEKFAKYNVQAITDIEDSSDNLIITPEVHTEIFNNFKKINKAIWWLSLDYYLDQFVHRRTKRFSEKRRIPMLLSYPILFVLKKYKYHFFKFKDNEKNIFHLYNCEYINEYLELNNVSDRNKMYLCGPLSSEFFEEKKEMTKENIVIYNPKKDNYFVNEIKQYVEKQNIGIKFVPIENMTSSECINLMERAKSYIDFGYFPGPERLPREAVMNYCNIITGMEGSSANEIDVPIPYKYKFNKDFRNIPAICNMIVDLSNNYEEHINEFNQYRNKVMRQKNNFQNDVKEFMEMVKIVD